MKKTKMLKKNYEFKKVLSKGKHFSGKNIDIVILKNLKNNNFLGIAVSTKIAKAVRRNRIKRLIRESFSSIEEKVKTGNSFVILCKKNINIKQVTFRDVQADIYGIFSKAGILIEENEYEKDNNKSN